MLERRIQKQSDEDEGKMVHQRDPKGGFPEKSSRKTISRVEKKGGECKRSMAVNVQVMRTVISVMKAKKAS